MRKIVVILITIFSLGQGIYGSVLYNVFIFQPELPGGYATYAESLNDFGRIVGSTWVTDGGWEHKRATLFDYSGADIDIGPLGRVHSEAHAVCNAGTIVGEMESLHAAIFDPGGVGNNIDLGQGYAFAVNDNSQIVGRSGDMARLWETDQTPHDLGWNGTAWGINDFGGIVGAGRIGNGPLGSLFLDYENGGQIVYLGDGEARDINNQWIAVGHSRFDDKNHATIFDISGEGNNINLGGLNSEAYSINEIGQIVGWSATPGYDHTAMLFDPTGSGDNIDLNTLIDPSYSGPHLRLALDVNNHGWIVGVAGQGVNSRGFLLTPIPEPCTLAMLGLGSLVTARRRRR